MSSVYHFRSSFLFCFRTRCPETPTTTGGREDTTGTGNSMGEVRKKPPRHTETTNVQTHQEEGKGVRTIKGEAKRLDWKEGLVDPKECRRRVLFRKPKVQIQGDRDSRSLERNKRTRLIFVLWTPVDVRHNELPISVRNHVRLRLRSDIVKDRHTGNRPKNWRVTRST